ncbi:MAG: hypothetical protein ACK52S_00645, partial [Pirellula sp.]
SWPQERKAGPRQEKLGRAQNSLLTPQKRGYSTVSVTLFLLVEWVPPLGIGSLSLASGLFCKIGVGEI